MTNKTNGTQRFRTQTKASFLSLSLLAIATTLSGGTALAADAELPSSIRIVVPFTPGGSNDVTARAVADELRKRTGHAVIVENKPGAAGFIGAADVARAPKDGSVLLVSSVSMITGAVTKEKPLVDIENDLAPVAIISEGPTLIVASNKSGIRTPADLIAAAKANPGAVTYASVGPGSLSHLAGEMLGDSANVSLTHVPYKGGSPAMNDIIGGIVDFAVGYTSGPIMPHIKAGNMQLIAVSSLEPSPALPGTPAMSSVVPGYDALLWTGVWAPAGTPRDVLERLNKEINEISTSPVIRDIAARDSAQPISLSLDETKTKISDTHAMWKDLAKKNNISID